MIPFMATMMMMCKNAQNVTNVFNGDLADAYRGGRSKLVERFSTNQPDRRGGISLLMMMVVKGCLYL